MMPINWISSLFMFICIFIIFMIMNYFIFNYKSHNLLPQKINKNMNTLIWKW
uniref:ATP synthase F0 subunit 8 n=1 Tax=Timelaea albescens TaxID=224128 RepID=D4QFL2_9NEOP|nr:ATP synthase F0 subunit 8 [Timelaea albescens]